MATPMPQTHREVYFSRAAAALQTHLVEGTLPSLSQITLLPPQLNPEFDVYDRRYLLQLTWALLSVPASAGLRTRVLIQGARKFGAIPLSIAGLRRTLDADLALSRDEWPPDCIRTGDLEAMEDIADDDDLFLVLSPTNAVSIPVVDSLRELAVQARGRPIISLNPRLADVPSHGGVMQVAGRAERMNFLDHFEHIFYLRLLFTSGTVRVCITIIFQFILPYACLTL